MKAEWFKWKTSILPLPLSTMFTFHCWKTRCVNSLCWRLFFKDTTALFKHNGDETVLHGFDLVFKVNRSSLVRVASKIERWRFGLWTPRGFWSYGLWKLNFSIGKDELSYLHILLSTCFLLLLEWNWVVIWILICFILLNKGFK